MEGHPHLNTLFILFNSENQPFRKVHRMIDLFESIIKTYTVVIISEYVKRNKLSDTAKELLAHGLRTPSLGTWQLFSRVLFEELNNEKHQWMFSDFKAAFEYLDKALEKEKTNAVSLRNSYAHGATPSDEKCTLDINKFEPFLNQLLYNKWFVTTEIEVIDGMVFMISGNNALCLHPILLYRREESPASFAFFNDLKNEKVGLLNYPLAKHYREKILYNEFHQYLPLHLWKTKGNYKFYQYIEELTETFKGRISEREALLQFVLKKNKGYLSVQGNPGIGKSALLAQLLKDLRVNVEDKTIQVVPYFIRRGTVQARVNHFLNYLINSTDEIFPQGRDIHAKDQTSWSLQSQLFQKWNQWAENNNENKILFLIDGLDEGIDDNMVEFMPRENFENILFIYGSRAGGHASINEFWGTLPTEHHTKLELKGLNREDIRSMIYDVANKYEVERESSWINAVQERSQGNPLYMKLLCEAIENGHIALNDFNALPKQIDDYYKAILQRYAKDNDGDALFLGLYTFAAAKNYLTIPQLGLINKLSDAKLERVGSTLKEVLNENPLTKDILDYQLFHESFREYLVKQNGVKIMEAVDRLINFCADWQTLEGTYEQRYALEYYAIHLIESKKEVHHKELLALLKNEPYQVAQKRVLKQFDATKQLYQLSLIKAGELNKHDIQLEAALGLLDLKYEVANDAPQIVLLIANGEIDLGLKRIESFAGPDEEGVKRKFILYMLCLMELTLLDSKDKSHRKISIEKLLNHLDEHLPVDQSLINWNDFFPSYLVFLMATEWAILGLDYLIVYKRTSDWENEWIREKGPYSDIQFEVLSACIKFSMSWEAMLIVYNELIIQEKREQASILLKEVLANIHNTSDELTKIAVMYELAILFLKLGNLEQALKLLDEASKFAISIRRFLNDPTIPDEISIEYVKLELLEDAIVFVNEFYEDESKIDIYLRISSVLTKQGKIEQSNKLMQESFNSACEESNDVLRDSLMVKIATEHIKQGKLEEALVFVNYILDDNSKIDVYLKMASELTKQGKLKEALVFVNYILDDNRKNYVYIEMASELTKQGKLEEALVFVNYILDDNSKIDVYLKMASELTKQGKLEEALVFVNYILDDNRKIDVYIEMASELTKQGKIEQSNKLMKEAYNSVYEESNDELREFLMVKLAAEYVRQERIEEAIVCIYDIDVNDSNIITFLEIASGLTKQGRLMQANGIMQKSFMAAFEEVEGYYNRDSLMVKLAAEYVRQGKIEEALICVYEIYDKMEKFGIYVEITNELVNQGKIEHLFKLWYESFNSIFEEYNVKDLLLVQIITEYINQGKLDEAVFVCLKIINNETKDNSWNELSIKFLDQENIKQENINKALICAFKISDNCFKIKVLLMIYTELIKMRKLEITAEIIQEILEITNNFDDELLKIRTLGEISMVLFKHGDTKQASKVVEDALVFANKSDYDLTKIHALSEIGILIFNHGNDKQATEVIEEALVFVRNISVYKLFFILDIPSKLIKGGAIKQGIKMLDDVLIRINYMKDNREQNTLFKLISVEYAIQRNFDKALNCVLKINNDYIKHVTFRDICIELLNNGLSDDVLLYTSVMTDDYWRSEIFVELARYFSSQGMFDEKIIMIQKAKDCALIINHDDFKREAFIKICIVLAEQGELKEAEKVLGYILDIQSSTNIRQYSICHSLVEIITKFAKRHNWQLAEKVSLEISEIALRHSCWQDIAIEISKQEGWQNALLHVNKLQKEEARFFYLKGLVKNLTIIESNSECLELVLPYLTNDTESIEKLMQNYALFELFFGDSDQNKIQRLNQSLNIKWAMDIKKEFPDVALSSREYANIKEWLHDIYDEDIKDQIELWSRQVSKGKISEDQFNAKVESFVKLDSYWFSPQ